MGEKYYNDRAFPNDGAWANNTPEGGMSLRDWFAGQALVGLLAGHPKLGSSGAGRMIDDAGVAECAYGIADAMIAERAK